MTITKKKENDILTIAIEGKIDTTTSPELEKELSSLEGINQVLFDFEKLEYISSSGLRVVLKCKKMINNTKVINCSSEVYDIFNMTGFSEIMDVEKALRTISIDNCEKIGEGFYGNIYRINEDTIVKVYKIPNSIDKIKKEIDLAKRAFVLGIPTAIPYDIVKVGDLNGAVFELLNAKSFVDLMDSKEELENFIKKSADILKDMHQKEIEEGLLPSRKKIVIDLLKDCESCFSKEIYDKLLHLLETIPERNTLLHCDFQIKNLMLQNDEILLIDMDTLSVGHPIFEFGSIYATYYAYPCIDKHNTDKFLGIPLETAHTIFDNIFNDYYQDKTEEEKEEIILKISTISYIQVLRLRYTYNDHSTITEQEIEFCKKYLTDIANKLDTLKYE